jgi:RING finger/CHY zinc finger protein 1
VNLTSPRILPLISGSCVQEDIHTSRIPSQIPPCNHLIHKTCFDEMLAAGHYACPLCGISMIPMSEIWKMYDKEIAESPMPEEYANLFAGIQCRDCLKASLVPFHLMGKYWLILIDTVVILLMS